MTAPIDPHHGGGGAGRCHRLVDRRAPGNLTFEIGDWLTRHSNEKQKLGLSKLEQTKLSATREVPFKTTFPRCFSPAAEPGNDVPWFALQRRFYLSNRGTVMLGMGRRPA